MNAARILLLFAFVFALMISPGQPFYYFRNKTKPRKKASVIKAMVLATCMLTIIGCEQFYRVPAKARFSILDNIQNGIETEANRDVAEAPAKKTTMLNLHKSELQTDKGELNLHFYEPDGFIGFSSKAVGLPADWSGFAKLQIKMTNNGTEILPLVLTIKGSRGQLHDTISLASKTKTIHHFDLADLPLTAGVQPTYQPQQVRISALKAVSDLTIHSLKLKGTLLHGKQAVADQFGQRKNKSWPGKITHEEQLIEQRIQEASGLSTKPMTDRDDFGGWLSGPQLEATGFFRLANHQGRYWFVTPTGKLMWSFGVTGIRPNAPDVGATRITGREYLFDKLPPKTGQMAKSWTSNDDASFYAWNILRKYDDLEQWRETAFKRLNSWGYNTIGNWSEPDLLKIAKTPFTISLNTNMPGSLATKGIADVFDPKWEPWVDSVFSHITEWKENPYLLGYFVDNEAGWGSLMLLSNMPAGSWAREEWLRFIQNRYHTLNNLNEKWEVAFKEWSDLRDLRHHLNNDYFLADEIAFETLFAQRYFSVIANNLKKYDPNHLYLGCRFTRSRKPDHICRVAGEFCDVITVNVYARTPSDDIMGEWVRQTGKPILIGEHHINLAGNRQVPALWGATPPDERRVYYRNYVETWAKLPYSLGCHWYQFSDQDITGRSSNGENQPIGLVDITDQPHSELIETARMLSERIYQWHFESTWPVENE